MHGCKINYSVILSEYSMVTLFKAPQLTNPIPSIPKILLIPVKNPTNPSHTLINKLAYTPNLYASGRSRWVTRQMQSMRMKRRMFSMPKPASTYGTG